MRWWWARVLVVAVTLASGAARAQDASAGDASTTSGVSVAPVETTIEVAAPASDVVVERAPGGDAEPVDTSETIAAPPPTIRRAREPIMGTAGERFGAMSGIGFGFHLEYVGASALTSSELSGGGLASERVGLAVLGPRVRVELVLARAFTIALLFGANEFSGASTVGNDVHYSQAATGVGFMFNGVLARASSFTFRLYFSLELTASSGRAGSAWIDTSANLGFRIGKAFARWGSVFIGVSAGPRLITTSWAEFRGSTSGGSIASLDLGGSLSIGLELRP